MLSASAYSFRQKSRLAISLSWVGGYTNVIAFMACGSFVSHVTGTTTLIGHHLVGGDLRGALFAGYLWLMFLCGAIASALMTETARRRGMASKYIPPMMAEALLLTLFTIALHAHRHHSLGGLYITAGLASLAMGLQNATITKISGAVVRTTHLTGVTTDLGLEGVAYCLWLWDQPARHAVGTGRARPACFAAASKPAARAPAGQHLRLIPAGSRPSERRAICAWGEVALAFPVGFLIWILYVDWRKPIADVREIDLMGDPELKVLGILKPLLPPELGIWRVSGRSHREMHRAPDFEIWASRVPRRWRVIILALSPLTHFDANAVLDLKAAIASLRRSGRRLVLSGITPRQYRMLVDAQIGSIMNLENICPDLEFAVARGIDLVQQPEAESPFTAATNVATG